MALSSFWVWLGSPAEATATFDSGVLGRLKQLDVAFVLWYYTFTTTLSLAAVQYWAILTRKDEHGDFSDAMMNLDRPPGNFTRRHLSTVLHGQDTLM